ncbi:MAG: trigger factor [Eubacterium sp.]|nr:trigger factor [Eubacterium sp.]
MDDEKKMNEAAERGAEIKEAVEEKVEAAEKKAEEAVDIVDEKLDAVEEKAEAAKEELKEKAEEAQEKAEAAEEELKEKAEAVKEELEEKAEKAKEEMDMNSAAAAAAVEGAVAEAKEKAAEKHEENKEKFEEFQDEVVEKAEEAQEKAEAAEEEMKENSEAATEAVEEAVEEVKSAKQQRKEEKAAKKAEKAAAEAEAAAKAKKTVSTKTVVLITLAICAAVLIGVVAYMNQPEKSIYEKVSNYDEYVTLGEYKGLKYTKEDIEVTDEEVKAEIDRRLQEKSTTEDSKKGKVKDGDNVNIDYVGKIDGKEFDGGSAEGYTLTIGSSTFIDGFEEGLIGKKIGDTVTLDLKFPDDYTNKDVAGKDVTFEVKLNSKQITNTPEYDEAFIKANSDYDNKADYEASVKKELEHDKEHTAEDTAKQSLWSEAVENAEVKKYPKGVVSQEKEAIIEQYKLMAENYNVEWADFLDQFMGTTEEDFDKQAKEYGKSVAKQKLVMYAIADKENLKLSGKEYKDRLKELLDNAGMTEKQFKEQYNQTIEEYADENDFKSQFMLEKIYDFLYENGKAVEPGSEEAKELEESQHDHEHDHEHEEEAAENE